MISSFSLKMDQQKMIILGGITIAFAISVYLIWGPTPRKKKGGVVGLVNLGSTCFLNTLLQSLASCALFVEWLDLQASEEKKLTTALTSVLWILNGKSETDTHSPANILSVLKKHGWVMPPGEQDAHELFHCIVSTLQEENSKPVKAGSLSDALPQSDTLSQTSDIIEDPFESFDLELLPRKASLTPPIGGDAADALSAGEDSEATAFYSADSEARGDDSGTLKQSPKIAEGQKRGYISRAGTTPTLSVSESPPFTGLLASSLTCCTCGHASSVRTDTFDSVSLPLGDAPIKMRHSLSDLVGRFVKTEIVPDVHCEKCGVNTGALKTYNFGKLPQCLCFHIVRTTWHSSSKSSSKLDDHVDFPEYLTMDPFTWRPGSSPPAMPTTLTAKHLYRLKSVVVHVGSVSSGHFLTFRRGPLSTLSRHKVDGKLRGCKDSLRWYMTSDETVELSSMSRAMDSLAYMLFYEKCSSDLRSTLAGEVSVVT